MKRILNNIDPVFYDYLTVIFFGLVIYLGALGQTGIRNDDINYAAIAKSVVNSDNIMILKRNTEIYLSKPPLFFWMSALSMKIFGVTSFGAKFVSAISTVMILVLIFKMAKDIFGNINAGYGAVLFFASNYTVYKVSHGVRLESLLTLTTIAGLFFAGKYLEKKHIGYIILSAVSCGLAVMTKGYLGVLMFVLICVFIIAFRKSAEIDKLPLHLVIAFLVFTLTFIWWYSYAFIHTDFFNKFFIKEALDRVDRDDTLWASVPFYKYSVSLFKYTFFAIPFIYLFFKKHRSVFRTDKTFLILTVFTAIYFVLIHFLSTKYARYLYPVSMFISIMAGVGLASVLQNSLRKFVLGFSIIVVMVFAFYPGSYGDESYMALRKLEKVAKLNGGMICTTPAFMRKWEDRSGVYFFTDNFKTDDCADNDVIIQRRNTDCEGITLVKNVRITACMKH